MTSTETLAERCQHCGHPSSWHRIDDSTPQPDNPNLWRFRCIGYDCDGPGFRHGTPESRCGCPSFARCDAGKETDHGTR